ncbi:MAG: hypothetical protein ACLGSD_07135 [Acidobacteriota bacterium]
MKYSAKLPRFASLVVMGALFLLAGGMTMAQAPTRLIGTITAINGNALTLKTDAGQTQQLTVPEGAAVKRLEPGQSLAAATAIQLSDLAVNDRVLVRLDTTANPPQANLIIAMKHSAVAEQQQKQREAWQQGVAGLVKTIDPAAGAITVTTGAGPSLRTVKVELTKSTGLLRYAPDSVNFADAKPAPLNAIKPGDQLRARGTYSADRSQLTADQVVSGTFRNVAGLVLAVDPSANKIVVKDLASKKPVTVHIQPDVQMRRLPERMAQMIAMRLKGTFPARGTAPHGPAAGSAGARWSMGQNPGGTAGPGGNDLSRVLAFAPSIKLPDLKKGDAVMVVATDGTTDVNAITLLAGVEPLLEAPEATDLLSNWSMGGGGAEAAAGPQ